MKRRDNPNRIPVSTETANEDAKTTKLIRNSIWLLIALGGRSVTSALVPKNASSTPKNPPLTDKSTLSVRSCFTRSQRLAPTESRTQISLARAPPRASSRLATLQQAIRRRKPTAARSTYTVVRIHGLTQWLKGLSRPVKPSAGKLFGLAAAKGARIERKSAEALCRETPGRRRPCTTTGRCCVGSFGRGSQMAG